MSDNLERAIGERLKRLRRDAGLSLEELARKSGVSKAMIARIEKAESVATFIVLERLSVALGLKLSAFVAQCEPTLARLRRFADQIVWRDPDTGARRRYAFCKREGVEIIVVELPGGCRITYNPWGPKGANQQVLMLAGRVSVHSGDDRYDLNRGDSLDFETHRTTIFENQSDQLAQYVVVGCS